MSDMNRDIGIMNRDIRIMNRNIRKMEIDNRKMKTSKMIMVNFIAVLMLICKVLSLTLIVFIILILGSPWTLESYSYPNMVFIDMPFSFSRNISGFSCNDMSCKIPIEFTTALSNMKKIYICEKYNCSIEKNNITCVCNKQSPKFVL